MQKSNEHQIVLPKSDVLKEYIQSFNILKEFASDQKSITYYTFPQSGTDISFFKASRIHISENEIEISSDPSQKPVAVFLGKYLTPLKVRYKGYVQKIAVHFTDTGVNYFFPNFYSTSGKKNIQSFSLEILDVDHEMLFSKDPLKGIEYLETYLLDKYISISIPFVERALQLLKEDLSIQTKKLAQQLLINEKTLTRRFKKHIGCTISEYKRITRFKRTAKNYFDSSHENLIQLCYDNGYYDASYFYKQIRKTALLNPKEFFKNIRRIGSKNRVYIFE